MRRVLLSVACLLAFSPAIPAFADVVTSVSGGTVVNIPNNQMFGKGPYQVALGITWSSDDPGAVFGYQSGWGLGSNNDWSGTPMVGNNSYDGSMTFTLDTPATSVGAFLSYYPDGNGSVTISAFGSANNLLETYNTSFSGLGYNEGRFLGFQEQSAEIKSFVISGPVIAASSLTIDGQGTGPTAVTPEPSSLVLLGTGLFGAVGSIRRRIRRA